MRYIVIGRVRPERADVNIPTLPFQINGGGSVTVSCEASQLTVIVDAVPIVDGWRDALIVAETFAQTALAALGLALGTGYTVEMTQVVEEDGRVTVVGTRPGGLAFDPFLSIYEGAIQLSKKDVHFRIALHDYMRAFAGVADCAFYCYRAIEALKCAFSSSDDGWPKMHAALGTTRVDIDTMIKRFADTPRHGNWSAILPGTAPERYAMLKLTRDILHKYMIWARVA